MYIDYQNIIDNNPWIIQENQKCIISPDIDGILCALFMSHYLHWEIVGYYDGKKLLLRENENFSDCVFLDMEVFRSDCKSIGQHMLMYNKNKLPPNWHQFSNTINPNNIRNFDAKSDFKFKYPLGTIHLLMCIVRNKLSFTLPPDAITILLYVDGTFKNLLNYPENCIDWLYYLRAKDKESPVSPLLNIFATQRISNVMHNLEDIFKKFKEIGGGKRGGDKIKLDNITEPSTKKEEIEKVEELICYISQITKWEFKKCKWEFDNLIQTNYVKKTENKLNNQNFNEILNKNPLSFAITATKRIEYTLIS